VQQLEDVLQRQILAEKAFSHVLLASPSSPIDYSIAPEPTRYQQVLPEVCAEHERWREAMMRSLQWYALVFIVEFHALQLALVKF